MTTTKTKNPVFSTSKDSLQADLNKIVSCQHIAINGQEITTNGKASSEFDIEITNGKNIPEGDSEMTSLAKQIAIEFENALQNKNEYQNYKVLFITKKEKGSLTTSAWKGKIFKLEDL
jgi:hypothetical protein